VAVTVTEFMKLDVNRYWDIGILVQQTDGVFTVLVVRNDRKINFEFINLAVRYSVWCLKP